MIHIRVDHEELNSKRRFACGIGPELPKGDTYYFADEAMADLKADCPGCNPNPRELGSPFSEISTQPGTKGYDNWVRISRSWGHD